VAVMKSGDGAGAWSDPAELDDETRADAVAVLLDVLEWQLVPQRWKWVEQLVDSFADALAGGDVAAMREATAELELAGPVRVTRIGATPLVAVPEPMRDRAEYLVHSLGSISRPPPEGPADSSGERGSGDDRKPTG
jgi:hypothetical protein